MLRLSIIVIITNSSITSPSTSWDHIDVNLVGPFFNVMYLVVVDDDLEVSCMATTTSLTNGLLKCLYKPSRGHSSLVKERDHL